jgi:phenol 2-monooxygenase
VPPILDPYPKPSLPYGLTRQSSRTASTPKVDFELASLPLVFAESKWTIYLDDIPEQDTQVLKATEKWLGALSPGEVGIVNVRPDNYIGSIRRFDTIVEDAGTDAARWLESYYSAFLNVP